MKYNIIDKFNFDDEELFNKYLENMEIDFHYLNLKIHLNYINKMIKNIFNNYKLPLEYNYN